MLQIGNEKTMTVKEVAEVLGCKPDTVQKIAKKLELEGKIARIEIRPDSTHALMLNEEQVTQIKQALVPRTLDMKVQGQNAVTEIEKEETILKAMQYMKERYEAAQERARVAESRIARLVHNNNTYTATEIAKELQMKSAQALNTALHERGIIFKDRRGVWVLYSEYANKGFQNIKQEEVDGYIRYYSEWTGIGREWLLGLFS